VAALALTSAESDRLAGARQEIQKLIDEAGADASVAFRMLDGSAELLYRPDVEYHAASTMKVPVMIELFKQVRSGRIKLDDVLPITNEFHSIVDRSIRSASATIPTPRFTRRSAERCRIANCARR